MIPINEESGAVNRTHHQRALMHVSNDFMKPILSSASTCL